MGTNLQRMRIGWILPLLLPSLAAAMEPAAGQVWMVSSRRAPYLCNCGADASQLDYWRLAPDGRWAPQSQAAFLAADDPALPTVFFFHGNRADESTAVNDGWSFYNVLRCQAGPRPLRYVIWSWPAERICGGVRGIRVDAQVKAWRSDGQSCYAAQLIARMNPRVPVTLVGYSFGTRIITGALEMLAGGPVSGQAVAPSPPPALRVMLRAVLVAAAEDCGGLLPCAQNGLALNQAERVLITVNTADPVLKRYPRLYGAGGPEALGYLGPAGGTDPSKIEIDNVSCSVGKTHDWDAYLSDRTLQARLAWYSFVLPDAGHGRD
jgi:hypothetical protein